MVHALHDVFALFLPFTTWLAVWKILRAHAWKCTRTDSSIHLPIIWTSCVYGYTAAWSPGRMPREERWSSRLEPESLAAFFAATWGQACCRHMHGLSHNMLLHMSVPCGYLNLGRMWLAYSYVQLYRRDMTRSCAGFVIVAPARTSIRVQVLAMPGRDQSIFAGLYQCRAPKAWCDCAKGFYLGLPWIVYQQQRVYNVYTYYI